MGLGFRVEGLGLRGVCYSTYAKQPPKIVQVSIKAPMSSNKTEVAGLGGRIGGLTSSRLRGFRCLTVEMEVSGVGCIL